MNQHLQTILQYIQLSEHLSEEEKTALLKEAKAADKELEITAFKLERTEKVKHTTAILLEETIEELEQKRKAVEAQNRELEIEASLERVRARAMAMQSSHELAELVATIFKELTHLDFPITSCFLWINNPDLSTDELWVASNELNKPLKPYYLKPFRHPYFKSIIHAWKEKNRNWIYKMTGEEKKIFQEKLFKELNNLPAAFIHALQVPDKVVFSASFSSFGALEIIGTESLSEEKFDILHRLGRVFDLSYTRFNDLKQAEAQARESQIQLALERVRARTMAMQRSDELMDAASLLFKQIEDLGTKSWSSGFIIFQPEDDSINSWMSKPDGSMGVPFNIPLTEDPFFIKIYKSYKKGEEFFVLESGGKELAETYRYMFSLPGAAKALGAIEDIGFQMPTFQITHCAFFPQGFLMFITYEHCPEMWDIFKRFGKVFEQTYTRFLDLQKAEAQAREAQIQLSLERVRACAMAMHHSDELSDVLSILFEQFDVLSIRPVDTHLDLFDLEKNTFSYRATGKEGKRVIAKQIVDLDSRPEWQSLADRWKKCKPNTVEFSYYPKEVINDLMAFFPDIWASMPPEAIMVPEVDFPDGIYDTLGYCKFGFLGFHHNRKTTEEENRILIRFANEFERLYQRFLDLQKSEAQAREAQIEAALERVRSRTMAMQHSDELLDVASILFQQVKALGVPQWNCGFDIWDIGDKEFTYYPGSPDGIISPSPCKIPLTEHPVFRRFDESRRRGDDLLIYEKQGEEQADHYRYMLSLPGVGDLLRSMLDAGFQLPTFQIDHVANFAYGNLIFITYEHFPEMHDVFKRFAKVFEQTYTRFLDLQKAEASTREAQIEASLERVRSKTMAMHNSNDVGETVATMFAEFVHLGIHTNRCGILIFGDETFSEVWTAKANPEGKSLLVIGGLNLNMHRLLSSVFKYWKAGNTFYQYDMIGDDLVNYYKSINDQKDYPVKFDLKTLPPKEFHSDFFFPEGAVFAFTNEPIAEEHAKIFKRFAAVFGQTYRRYLDLLKAETQAREAIIEAALEKVRGKAMAMHNSNDLSVTASMVFTELRKLGINPIRCGVGLLNKESLKAQLYSATSSADGESLSLVGWVQLTGHPVLDKIYDSLVNIEEYYPVLEGGKQLRAYYKLLLAGLSVPVPDFTDDQKQYGHFIPFSVGCLYAWADVKYNDDEIKILRRFATIIDLTFRRYIELQKSEANAREAVKQAALDRVRAEIASMRTTADLERITPLIWNELTILGIPFIRCGVFIMDDSQQLTHTFLSTPEGKAIAAFHIPYDTPGKISLILKYWQNKEKYLDHWDEEAFTEFAHTLVKQGALASPEQYLKTLPRGGFYLHFLPFLQGMLYVGNSTQLPEEEIKLIQSIADAFATAYARYEDFNKLEAAKKQVDSTLNELQATQKQLIQSEKMASLGELTAGIAHEIQNPLNFVNNFSEVSNELLDEMNAEIEKGDMDEAKAIATDIKQNQEKILHHGKRADAIVKGMLQHSRTSTGSKRTNKHKCIGR